MRKIIILFVLLLFLSSCSSGISKNEAEDTAIYFVNTYGTFAVNESGDSEEVLSKDIKIVSTDKISGEWHVALKITTLTEEDEKSGEITVVVGEDNTVKGIIIDNSIKRFG